MDKQAVRPARVCRSEAAPRQTQATFARYTTLQWFALRRTLESVSHSEALLYRGATAAAFNQRRKAEQILRTVIARAPQSDEAYQAHEWLTYVRSYIGGNYRFNPQDSLVYSTMPETGDPLPQLEVTARCVSSPKTPVSD